MTAQKEMFVVYKPEHVNEARSQAEHGATIVCLDFWTSRELEKSAIPFVPLTDFIDDKSGKEEWWSLTLGIAHEWYRLPAMKYFQHDGISIGETLEPMVESYLNTLFSFVRIYEALKKRYPEAHLHIPLPSSEFAMTVSSVAFFQQWAVIDAAQMVGFDVLKLGERVIPSEHLFPRARWKSILIRAYNAVLFLVPRRAFKVYASEYWRNISPVIAQMDDTEFVLMESSELHKIPWRQIFRHRIRIKHPADVIHDREQRAAMRVSDEFLKQWESSQKDVAAYLASIRSDLNWSPALSALTYLQSYSTRIVADINAFRRIMCDEKPNVVLQRASVGQQHFLLMAHIATQLRIPSVEVQHAGAVFDPRWIFSKLETSCLAAYGEVEREEYARNGYEPERIVLVGSPRFDRYLAEINRLTARRAETIKILNLNPQLPIVLFVVPTEQVGVCPISTHSYEMAHYFREVREAQKKIPGLQVLLKFRPGSCTDAHRAFLHELFEQGGVAVAEFEDPYVLICASDAVVSGYSTMMYEAMIMKKHLMLYPWRDYDYHLGVYGPIAPLANTAMELADILKQILGNAQYRQELLERQQRFMNRHLFDGHSAERVAALLHHVQNVI